MKRVLIVCVILVVLLNLTTLAQASELYDSINVPQEKKELIYADRINEESDIIRIYECPHTLDKFADGWNVLAIAYASNEVYMVPLDPVDRFAYFTYVEDNISKGCKPSIYTEGFWTVYQYILHPELVFDSSVQVQNVFCFYDDLHDSHDGLCIYYITDQGDYILYKMWSGAEEMYLFTAEEFYPLTEALIELRQENLKYGAGLDMLDSVCDIEQYRFNPDQQSDDRGNDEPNQDPQEPTQPGDHTDSTNPPTAPDDSIAPPAWILPVVICGSIVVVGAIAAVVLLKKRKSA